MGIIFIKKKFLILKSELLYLTYIKFIISIKIKKKDIFDIIIFLKSKLLT